MKQLYKDSDQESAIHHGDGPACIIAGPGSGKTTILTHRISVLIGERHVPPSSILVITFTRAAAKEMRSRFCKLSTGAEDLPLFGTFHSVYLNFLKYFGAGNIPSIIDNKTQNAILKDILTGSKAYAASPYFAPENAEDLISAISYMKASGYHVPEEYPKDLFQRFFKEYEDALQAAGLMDFDDILIRLKKLLDSDPKYADHLKKRFSHILVDEFQDINRLQYELLNRIVNESHNIFIVGDDDQAIYGFRGASPGIMQEFIKDYPESKIIELRTNYRCGERIIKASDQVISHNSGRLKCKDHVAGSKDFKGTFLIRPFSSREEEREDLKKSYLKEIREGKSAVILVRTNKDATLLKEYFEQGTQPGPGEKLATDLKGEIYGDLLAYLSFCRDGDRGALFRILNKPVRYLNRDLFPEKTVDLGRVSAKYQGSLKGNSLEILKRQTQVLKRSGPLSFLLYLWNIVGYGKYLEDAYPSQKGKGKKILEEVTNLARGSASLSEFGMKLKEAEPGREEQKTDTQVNVMTFHAAKGLEFDTVFLPGVNEGKIPGRASVRSGDVEEERRLFYVAMTRARDKLILSYVKGDDSMRMLPSRFITEFLTEEA